MKRAEAAQATDRVGKIGLERCANSEFGMRNAEVLKPERSVPHSAFRIPHSNPARRPYFFALIALLAITGCEDGIDSTYGQRSGLGADSVNGTAVLSRMFEQAGHDVSTSGRLTPKLMHKADVIVWAPDDFAPPSSQVRDWFDDWWASASGRTLIYIGRDYDAAPGYWKKVQAGAPPGQLVEIKRRQAAAQSRYLQQRTAMPADEDCEWFTVKGKRNRVGVTTLAGDADWLTGVDVSKLEIELNGRLVPAADAQTVLSSGSDAIVSRRIVSGGKLIVVVNGSFLLNLPLVNHEHRKLAARLIAKVGAKRQVVFLESEAGGPPVFDEDPLDVPRNGMEIFGVRPFDSILLHLALAGMIFCAARFPVFGRAREPAPPRLSDFSRHVWALGQMLARTKDRAYALSRVLHYQQNSRDPGRPRPSAAAAPPKSAPPKSTPPQAD